MVITPPGKREVFKIAAGTKEKEEREREAVGWDPLHPKRPQASATHTFTKTCRPLAPGGERRRAQRGPGRTRGVRDKRQRQRRTERGAGVGCPA